jgi:hypothetical protein
VFAILSGHAAVLGEKYVIVAPDANARRLSTAAGRRREPDVRSQ